MADIISFEKFKSIEEWKEFAEKQFLTIQFLQEANRNLQAELDELKARASKPSFQGAVETVIVSPEQALLEGQIDLIQKRAYLNELSLEDVKKLDILLKHHRILKGEAADLDGKPKTPQLSQADLLKIAQNGSNSS